MSSTIWLKDIGYGAGGSTLLRELPVPSREVISDLEGLLLIAEGSDADAVTDVPLARDGDSRARQIW